MDRIKHGKRFTKRIYYPRILGTILCAPIILESIIHQQNFLILASLLFINVAIWPHVAYRISNRSKNPYMAEIRNLDVDSLLCGLWMGAIGLNPISSISLSAMVAMNAINTGGLKSLKKGLTLQASGILAWQILVGIDLQQSSILSAWSSLPLLTLYPISVSFTSYKLASELYKIKNTLNSLSITDELTGLLNRRYLDEELKNIASSNNRKNNTFLIVLDLDNFKAVNDRYGHPTGDSILCLLSKTLRSSLRSADLIARFGGDEFCIIMEGVSLEQAATIIERACQNFKINSAHIVAPSLSVSVGIASWHDEFESAKQWFAHADSLLYKAKKSGRNRIVTDSPHCAPTVVQ
ncbi:diguanylate cyclase [Pseudomonas sp. RHF3.3-3]|uniref:diguanylate cyclase n=1 Tax=Pseudomonas asplenii TaxID=53407 RepID=A0A0M9GI43_9PSED|nr:diguanylate cyclase [Pseudomonas fuscovaginae]KPA91470.1 diguanylate cyclase (GGDEF) domain-containing protein [Pseudomonas fuscovaginae]